MKKPDIETPEEEIMEAEVSSELEEAKNFAKTLSPDDVKSGQWFVALLQKVVQSYDRNARAEYLQQKYPGLPPDEIADKLTSITVRYATIAGAVAGSAASAGQIATLLSGGMSVAVMVGAIGTEMFYLSRIQMRLVLDMTVVYDTQLDSDDPEDMLMIFGYALGVAPAEMLGKGAQVAAKGATEYAIKKYVSKGTLKAIQDMGKKIGVRILQKTVLKYGVPVISAAVGSSYNYVTTKSVGAIAKAHIRNRGQVTDELRLLVSRQNTYTLAFPAAAMYMAQVDGEFSAKEKELYRALLSRMSFEKHTQAEFQKLIANEENILSAISDIEDDEVKNSLVEIMVLMSIYDGELTDPERDFLEKTAVHLDIPLDIGEVEKRASDYRITVEESVFDKTAGVAKSAASKATNVAGQAAGSVKDVAKTAGDRVTGTFGKVFRRKKGNAPDVAAENVGTVCPNCKEDVAEGFEFCPHCGHPMATEKACISCNEIIPIEFSFCPHCGASQS